MAFPYQTAIITGASSGIGWETAKLIASRGCHVGLIARREQNLADLAAEIMRAGGRAAYAVANVADREATLTAFAELRQTLGPIDLLLANAGIGLPTEIEPMNLEGVDNMIRVNFLGVVYSIAGVLPEMLERGRGHLAAVSSLASYAAFPGESGYCASKAAVNYYMDGLRLQLRRRGIPVTTICPGFIKTPMTEVNEFPMPFVMDAARAAVHIVHAIVKRKKIYNFPWQTALMMKLAGWAPDWLLTRIVGRYTDKRARPSE